MKTTISDLWNGRIAPFEHCGAHNHEINCLHLLIEESREKLWDELTQEQKVQFQKYIDLSNDYLFHMLELAFCEGFTLGNKMAFEVFV